MSIKDWFKRKVEVRYVECPPRYQPLGHAGKHLVFIDAHEGAIYGLHEDFSQNQIVIAKLANI